MLFVAFFYDASPFKNFSFSDFEAGKIGISGTDSSTLRVILRLATKGEIKFKLYLKGDDVDISGYGYMQKVSGVLEGIEQAGKDNVDYLVLNFIKNFELLKQVILAAEEKKVKLLIWAQNPIAKQSADLLVNSNEVVKVIYVETNDLNHTRHTPIFNKGIVIPNGIEKEIYTENDIVAPNNLDVLYLGSLTPGKGFHYLAKAWAGVLKIFPNARLVVIGSGKLYNNYAKLGPLGVADEQYEKELAPYIGNTKEQLEKNNIVLYGMLNRNEVINLIRKANLVCINPTYRGSLESCSVSSLEVQMSGLPVIGGKAGGNLNTIIDGKTGILVKNESQLTQAIVKLLKDKKLNIKMRGNARQYALDKYEIQHIVNLWLATFDRLKKNEKFPLPKITAQERSEYKLLIKEGIRLLKRLKPSK